MRHIKLREPKDASAAAVKTMVRQAAGGQQLLTGRVISVNDGSINLARDRRRGALRGTTDATGSVSASAIGVGGNALTHLFGGQGGFGGGRGTSPSPSPTVTR